MTINEELDMYINNGRKIGLTDEEIISKATNEINEFAGCMIATRIRWNKDHPNGFDIREGYGKWERVD